VKKYDSVSIKNRLIQKLKNYSGWNKIIEDSVIDILLSTISEGFSEVDRYYEYLLREAKWDTCQNLSSLLAMLNLFNYQPKRKISSIGHIVISHNTLENILSSEELENLSEYNDDAVLISKGTTLYLNSIPFTVTDNVLYDLGSKYKLIPVIQGVYKTVELEPMQTIEFLRVFYNNANIEAALDTVSSSFFSVELILPDLTVVPCRIVENILLASNDEYAVQVINKVSGEETDLGIELLFGNNVSGLIPPNNSRIRLSYIETLGSEGVVNEIIEYFNTIVINSKQFYYSNLESLVGGKDGDTIEDLRNKVPTELKQNETVVTLKDYLTEIEKIPYVAKANTKSGIYTEPGTDVIKEAILFTAIKSDKSVPDTNTIEDDILSRIEDRKSPFDIVKFQAPNKVELGIDYVRKQKNVYDTNSLQKEITDIIYNEYNIFSIPFGASIASYNVSSTVEDILGKGTLVCQLRAKKSIVYENFIDDSFGNKYYIFSFDPSFSYLRRGNEIPYIERIDLRCRCINNTIYERTILVSRDDSGNQKLMQFYYKDLKDKVLTVDSLTAMISSGVITPIEPSSSDYFPIDISIVNSSNLLQTTIMLNNAAINYLVDKLPYFEVFAFPLNYNSNEIKLMSDFDIFDILYEDIKVQVEVSNE